MFVVGLGSVDSFEQVALGSERGIAKHRAVQIQAIRQLDQSQVDLVDGCRSMTDWVALSARCKSFHRAGSGVPGQSQRCGSGGDAGSRGDRSGPGGQIIEKALFQRADELPTAPGVDRAQKLADAFTLICTDNLTGSSEGRAVTVAEVFIDATLAAPTNGEAGVTLSSGTRVGPNTLSEILCTGKIRLIVTGADSRPIGVSDLGEAIPQRSEPSCGKGTKAPAPSMPATAATGYNHITSSNVTTAVITTPTTSPCSVGITTTSPSTCWE